jgi:hypothetical protein
MAWGLLPGTSNNHNMIALTTANGCSETGAECSNQEREKGPQ